MARPPLPIWYRFWSKVELGADAVCWPWTGAINAVSGYGQFNFFGENKQAHRVAYIIVNGPIPAGLTIDHVRAWGCILKNCVNPGHLEAVTMGENVLRGATLAARKAAQTHCIRGHEFTPENTLRSTRGTRYCRECNRINCHEAYQKRRATASRR